MAQSVLALYTVQAPWFPQDLQNPLKSIIPCSLLQEHHVSSPLRGELPVVSPSPSVFLPSREGRSGYPAACSRVVELCCGALFNFTMFSFSVNFAYPMKMSKVIPVICLLLLPLLLCAAGPDQLVKIDVTGNERIEKGFITNNIKSKEGDAYDLEKLRDDMKNIYKTGFFSDVQIDVKDTERGKVVTFVVIERPPVKAIYVTGNKKIKTPDITDKLKIRTNTVLNIDRIKESMDEIRKLYASKAYYATRVSYNIEYPEPNEAVLTFSIEEPERAYVRKVKFTGNKIFKDSKLKNYMRVREKGWFSWFTGSGLLDEESLEDDRKNIEAFYHDNGYVRASVGIPDIEVSKDQTRISITLPVEEGKVYKVGNIDFKGDVIFSREDLVKDMKSKSGKTFRASAYQEDVLRFIDLYQDKGYAFCDIVPLTLIDDDGLQVNMTFEISKGKEIYFNRVNILGNTRTRDKVIRRELRFAEGDRFSATKLKTSKRFLRNTTFFKDVDMKIVKTEDPEKVNLDITVDERPTGTLSVGVGYSSVDKAIVTGTISQDNLMGTGRKAFLEAALSAYTREFRFTFVEPYLLDMNLSTALSLFNFRRYLDTYDYQASGGSVSLLRPLTDDIKAGLRYRYETVSVENIDSSASSYIKEQEGTRSTSSVTASLQKNTIDDVLNPTKGVNSELSFEVAGGPFGGDNDFYRTVGSYGRYIPAGFFDSSFFVRGVAGFIRPYGGKTVPVYEKFFVGGMHTVRGFKYGEAGPKDSAEEVIGSKNQLFFNLEYLFPIYKPAGLRGVVFFDAGHGFDENEGFLLRGIRYSSGFGIRWFSPIGPIRLELGFNLSPKPGEPRNVFDFAIGTQY
jgi:outer membrane protein insertion porin family